MPKVVPSQVVELIDKFFPWAATQKDSQDNRFSIDKGYKDALAAIIELIDKIPEELIRIDGEDYISLQLALTSINNTLPLWRNNQPINLDRIRGHGNLNPVTMLRTALLKCPDEGASPSISDLTFISQPEFRETLRIDISSANQAFQNGEWKATTVLAGSTIEAILLFVLHSVKSSDPSKIKTAISELVANGTFDKSPGNNLDRYTLYQLSKISSHIDLIKSETETQIDIARDFRNLIHPGVSVRKNITCNRGTALSALAGLEHAINDLKSYSP